MKKLFNALPNGNESADIEPARYFNLAIKQINEIEEWMRDTKEIAQPLLLHIDVFVYLSKKYPDMASRRKENLNVPQIKKTFNEWFERVKIPTQFKADIKASGDQLIAELEAI